jgi:phage terminase large subunit-like protein
MDIEYTYETYADDVLNGKIKSCEAIQLACKRYKEWFTRDDIYFDKDDVEQKIRVVSRLKHFTGKHNHQPFILLPWQQFCVANIFGWKYKRNNLRVTRNVFIMISRKAGKTAFASALGILCAIADNENGAEVELVANSRQQAKIAFDITSNFCESVDTKGKIFKRYRDTILIEKTKSKIQILSSDAMGNDGYNSSCFVLDEFHAAKNWDLYNVMKSSQGMREQPLAIIITTAGFLLNGYPCYEHRLNCIDILKGNKVDDSQFTCIYELDEGDDWEDESNWEKCAPSLGQTVSYDYLREQIVAAKNNSALETGVRTKNFNQFCQTKEVWIPDTYLTNAFDKYTIEDFQDEDCFMGVDLSAVSDLTAVSVLFPPNEERKIHPDKFVFKNFIYVPESAIEESVNGDLYKLWRRQKHIKVTSGNVVDYDYILKDQMDVYNKTYLLAIGYDSWNATQWAINATSEGLPLYPYSQAIGNFNKPTKAFEMLIRQGKVVMDFNPCVRWCFNNVELKYDYNDNCKPVKSGGNQDRKIDPVIAMVQALGTYLNKTGEGISDGEVLSVENNFSK